MLHYGLLEKSFDCVDLCEGYTWLYTVYCFKNHFYRFTNSGLITAADEEDIKIAKESMEILYGITVQ